jgi:MraZ protein
VHNSGMAFVPEIFKMSITGSRDTVYYHSQFRHGVDEKRRVQIPAKWRPVNEGVEFTVIMWPNGQWTEGNLLVLPPEQAEILNSKFNGMSFSDPKAQALRRLIGSRSAKVTLDKAGRMCLPENMAKIVEIGAEATLVGLVDRFEIWNPKRYEAISAADARLLHEAFKLI